MVNVLVNVFSREARAVQVMVFSKLLQFCVECIKHQNTVEFSQLKKIAMIIFKWLSRLLKLLSVKKK